MRGADGAFDYITSHSRVVIAALLVVTLLAGTGVSKVDQSSSLGQFQGDTTERQKLDYIKYNFSTGNENATTVQLIVRGENVLRKGTLIDTLELQQRLRSNRTVNRTLRSENPTAGIANVIATTAIRQGQARELQVRSRQLQQRGAELNATVGNLSDLLNRTRGLQREYDALNRSRERGEVDDETYRNRSASIEGQLRNVRGGADPLLNATQYDRFERLFDRTRTLQHRLDRLNASYAAGETNESTYRERASEIRSQFRTVYRQRLPGVLRDEFQSLRERGDELQADRAALQNASAPGIGDQIARLESMNRSEIDRVVATVLGDGGGGDGQASQAFAFMPTSYDTGSTTAEATMLVVFQTQQGETIQGQAPERLVESQQAIQSIATDAVESGEVLVFGSGIISQEIEQSMADSLAIVGPLALLFVILTLLIAYRDLLDIALGLVGIAVVLVWTFGFMGWAGVTFNQIFIAVPVLLIGLSIDYAIHIFMRHREERAAFSGRSETGAGDPGAGSSAVRGSMRTALGSVGVALTWVTATTVIGFLSNLSSPLPPIRDFGVVSSFGIVAALVVFGALIPALKVEIDSALEARGIDRQKRAFGTGGGGLSKLLSVGAIAARKAPWVVVALTLVVSLAGAYGATQVDTSFQQTDFLADDPPEWMDELPEPFRPGDYSAKANLEYVNENFVVENSQSQILIEGNLTRDDALERIQRAQDRAAGTDVVVVLSNDEPEITSPLSVMRDVAATNESFNRTVAAADANGDGVPDRNLEGVYDALFDAAPDRARGVINREDGEYVAARMVVSVEGNAPGSAVTDQMRDVAAAVDGDGLRATATGQPIVFQLVNDQLLDTVIKSLLITLVAVFAFLMLAYRITHGSATLGAITLLPVAFSVSWILGTMYLLGMPFNVLTGMITSLTVGLGVAYSIHLSERYNVELERRSSVREAMRTSVTGTGGALLGSAATTVGGFGVLGFAILPALQQFGIITGLTIIYAFLASVLVLPSLLALWTGRFRPNAAAEPAVSEGEAATVPNGGTDEGRDPDGPE